MSSSSSRRCTVALAMLLALSLAYSVLNMHALTIAILQWDVHNITTQNKENKRFSEPFMIGGYPWYVSAMNELS